LGSKDKRGWGLWWKHVVLNGEIQTRGKKSHNRADRMVCAYDQPAGAGERTHKEKVLKRPRLRRRKRTKKRR